MAHPSEGVLQAFIDGELAADERARVSAHLEQCADCRSEVEQLSVAAAAFAGASEEDRAQVLTREMIFDRVWGYDFGGESNVLEVYIRYLRQKLEAEQEPRLIHTVRGVGYVMRENP